MNAKKTIVAGMCVLFLMAGSVSAVNWSDDFETDDFSTKWPDVWAGGTGTAGRVANPDGTGYVLHVKSDTDSDWAAVRSQSIGETLNQTSVFNVEFDVYFPTVSTMSTNYLWTGGSNFFGPSLVFRWGETHTSGSPYDYTFDYRDDSNFQQLTNSNIVTATWTKVHIDASGDGNYDVYVGGHTAGDKIGTFDMRDGDWDRIFLGEGSGSSYSGEFYMDNIVITPEPATMVLLGMGGIGLLVRRRRRA